VVAEFSPFRGVRYDCAALGTDLGMLAAPPYDVIDDDHRDALEANHPENSVRLILPRDHAGGDRYERAAATFAAWEAGGLLTRDPSQRLYGYRMDYTDHCGRSRHTIGVLGALALPKHAGAGDILPHERTLPKAKSDRLDLLRATRVNLDPIWGLSTGAGLTRLISLDHELCSCVDDDGVFHRLFAIDDPASVAGIARAVASAPLVLADGHHRFETAIAYRDERPAADEGAGSILCLVVELTDDELCIHAIHRLATVPDRFDVLGALDQAFEVRAAGANTADAVEVLQRRMQSERGIGLALPDALHLLIPRSEVCAAALSSEPEPVRETDAALVEAVVVPRLPSAQWRYRHDRAEVAAIVAKGDASLALLLRPVSVAATRAAAIARVRMPQKTTFFYPKPRTGMVFRALDAPRD